MTETVVCVGAVVTKDDRVLLVRQAEGHSLQGKWTIPWGRLDPGESPSAAVLREAWEEGSIRAEIVGLLGVQEIPPPWDGQIAILYLCRHVAGEPAPDNHETDAARYFADSDIETLAESVEPFSCWLIRRVLNGRVSLTRENPTNPFRLRAGYI
jgi:8-oxo-dGTP diphosphatase